MSLWSVRPASPTLPGLPPELRLLIYSHLEREARPHLQITHTGAASLWPSKLCRALPALSRTCKLLHSETHKMLYSTPNAFEIRGNQWQGCTPYGSEQLNDRMMDFLLRMRRVSISFRWVVSRDDARRTVPMLIERLEQVLYKLRTSKALGYLELRIVWQHRELDYLKILSREYRKLWVVLTREEEMRSVEKEITSGLITAAVIRYAWGRLAL